jgi:hypothetical protein
MALFLEIHELSALGTETFLADWIARADDRTRCLKNWTSGTSIAFLVEAPDDYGSRPRGPGVRELTELFAPASRWLDHDTLDLAS